MREKEDLLKESRAKLSTMDNVKTQIDVLMKVWFVSPTLFRQLTLFFFRHLDSFRDTEEG